MTMDYAGAMRQRVDVRERAAHWLHVNRLQEGDRVVGVSADPSACGYPARCR